MAVTAMPSLHSSPCGSVAQGIVRHAECSSRLNGQTRAMSRLCSLCFRVLTVRDHSHRCGKSRARERRMVVRAGESNRGEDSKNVRGNVSISSEADDNPSLVLRAAWYGAEALGNIVAFFNPKEPTAPFESTDTLEGPLSREYVVKSIVDDYDKGYFVTGNVTTGIYEEDCEFADPAGSFKSLNRFKNNCSNFGSLLERSDVKLMKSEEQEEKFVAYWRFSCVLKFPWRPILSSTGFTEYYFNSDSGRICRLLNVNPFLLFAIPVFCNSELLSGMWRIGMFQKWPCWAKYLSPILLSRKDNIKADKSASSVWYQKYKDDDKLGHILDVSCCNCDVL